MTGTGNGIEEARRMYWRARDLAGRGEYTRALQCLDRAIAIAPRFSLAHREKGNCSLRQGRFWEAVTSYDMAISLSGQEGSPDRSGVK